MDMYGCIFNFITTRIRCTKMTKVIDEGPPISVAHQLGSDPRITARNEWDKRLLSYIVPPEKIPPTLRPILYSLVRRDVVVRRKNFWDSLTENYLVLLNSIDGRGQNNIIRAENALKGLPVPITSVPEKPSALDKIFDRDKVKRYERWEERQELGLE